LALSFGLIEFAALLGRQYSPNFVVHLRNYDLHLGKGLTQNRVQFGAMAFKNFINLVTLRRG
jgi:hypothetical protein